jgi:NAD(P)-dependent dehydrogenase (short-subunit alcohol dehydrogenase family)
MLVQARAADMIAAGRGAIVNIARVSAIGPGRGPYADQTVRGGVMYGASKAALERFTQGWRRRWRITAASP